MSAVTDLELEDKRGEKGVGCQEIEIGSKSQIIHHESHAHVLTLSVADVFTSNE